MKKIFALIMASLMALSLAACASAEKAGADTVAGKLKEDFDQFVGENAAASAQEIAEHLLQNEVIAFSGGVVPVEPGLLMGFGETEITGFDEAAMFAPMIGTIPFVGYIFDLSEGTDADGFVETLKTSGDLRWNICTEAEELVTGSNGGKVFFVMSPMSFEENQ